MADGCGVANTKCGVRYCAARIHSNPSLAAIRLVLGSVGIHSSRSSQGLRNARPYNPIENIHGLRRNFLPFHKGQHNCIGQGLALMNLNLTVARKLWNLDCRIAPGTKLGEGSCELGWAKEDANVYQDKDYFVNGRRDRVCSSDGGKMFLLSTMQLSLILSSKYLFNDGSVSSNLSSARIPP